LSTCPKAEALAELAREHGHDVTLDYFAGLTRVGYDDGSTRITDDERAAVMVGGRSFVAVAAFIREQDATRWKLFERPTVIVDNVEYWSSLRDVEALIVDEFTHVERYRSTRDA
jgi:hypothetical protein